MATQTAIELMECFNAQFIENERLTYRVASDSWLLDGFAVTTGKLKSLVAYELEAPLFKVQLVLDRKAADYQKDTLGDLTHWIWHLDVPGREDDAELRRWLGGMQRADTPPDVAEAHVWAMKQWIWQVKRHVLGKPVNWHVLPIFWSKENGTGKSLNLQRLLEPLAHYTRNLNVPDLGDKFGAQLFSRSYVVFLDEFVGADGADTALFKSLITGRPLEARSMYSEQGFHSVNRLSCIATSNDLPPHGFEDVSGARRLWSIHCSGEPCALNSPRAQLLDSIDIERVWAAVSSTHSSVRALIPSPMRALMERVREDQLRARTSFEAFVEEELEPATEDFRMPVKHVLEAYKRYCSEATLLKLRGGSRVTAERLRSLGFGVVNKSNRFFLKGYRLKRDIEGLECL